jgi:hypothetical protein
MGAAAIVVIGAVMAVATGVTVPVVVIAGSALAILGLGAALSRDRTAAVLPRWLFTRERSSRTADDLDGPTRALLERAVLASETITASQVFHGGLVDRAAVSRILADQQRDIAAALREHARLRTSRAQLPAFSAGPMTGEVRGGLSDAAELAESSLTARVEALERYAAEIRQADAAYRDWQQAARLSTLHGQHLDLLARTAADEYQIADIEALSQQARAVRLALSEPPVL